MKARVEISKAAEEEYARLNAWWSAHRRDAAEQVANELERLIVLLSEQPEIGKLHSRRVKNVRWVPLNKTPYKLFYRFDAERGVVTFMSIWSAMRRRGPQKI